MKHLHVFSPIACFFVIGCLSNMAVAQTTVKKSNTQLDRECGLKVRASCAKLGVRHQYATHNTPRNYATAAKYYQKACKLGFTDSCGGLGNLYMYGKGVKKNYATARLYLLNACKKRNALSCYDLAYLYQKGWGVTKNLSTSRLYYESACLGTYKRACTNVALFYKLGIGGVKKNDSMAFSKFRTACDKGKSGLGCYYLANYYSKGIMVKPNPAYARVLMTRSCNYKYKKACNQSSPSAIDSSNNAAAARARLLGKKAPVAAKPMTPAEAARARLLGKKVPTNDNDTQKPMTPAEIARARLLGQKITPPKPKPSPKFVKSPHVENCESGMAKSCSIMAYYYLSGKNTSYPKNYSKSFAYYDKACKLGSARGCGGVGFMHKQGWGTKKDFAKSLTYLKLACKLNYGISCYDIGVMQEKGMGVKKDDKAAFKNYKKACDSTYPRACVDVGVFHQNGRGGQKKNINTAAEYYNKGCKAKRGYGCYLMGEFYRKGDGIKPHRGKARDMYKLACKYNYKYACKIKY